MEEQWKSIDGFEGIYEVSDCGRVKSLARVIPHKTSGKLTLRERVMAQSLAATGKYPMVNLWRHNKQTPCYVHRLVLSAFVGPSPEGAAGCHYDGDRSNNHVSNLRWDGRAGNMQDAIRHDTAPRGERHGFAKLTRDQVRAIRADDRISRLIAADYGVTRQAVGDIKTRRNWGWLE